MLNANTAHRAAVAIAGLADPYRLRAAYLLADRPWAVGELGAVLGLTTFHMSYHLRFMRDAGLLEAVKDGNRRLYRFRHGVWRAGGASEVGSVVVGPCRLTLMAPPVPDA